MDVKRIIGINNVNVDEWHQVTEGHPFTTREWMRFSEQYTKIQGHYVIITQDDVPIAGASFWVQNDFDDLDMSMENRVGYRFLKWYLRRSPLLMIRAAEGTQHPGIYLPDDAQLAQQALRLILQEAKKVLKAVGGSFILADYLEPQHIHYEWDDFFVLDDFMEASTKLELMDYETYDDYMQAIKSIKKKRWKNIRNNTRYAQEDGISIEFQKEPPPKEVAIPLIHEQILKYEGLTHREREAFDLHRTVNANGWILAYQAGRLVACEGYYYDERTGVYIPKLFGRDADVDLVYFYVYYSAIQHAIEDLDASIMIGGAGSEHVKVRLGFIADKRNSMTLYAASPIARWIASMVIPMVESQNEDPTTEVPETMEDSV